MQFNLQGTNGSTKHHDQCVTHHTILSSGRSNHLVVASKPSSTAIVYLDASLATSTAAHSWSNPQAWIKFPTCDPSTLYTAPWIILATIIFMIDHQYATGVSMGWSPTKKRLVASLSILTWAAALQLHMYYLQRTDEFKAKFPDLAPEDTLRVRVKGQHSAER